MIKHDKINFSDRRSVGHLFEEPGFLIDYMYSALKGFDKILEDTNYGIRLSAYSFVVDHS
jgi:hypothetical protein